LHPSAPLTAIRAKVAPGAVGFYSGDYPEAAAKLAAQADVAIVFATQWTTEGLDAADLSLPNGQDALIAAVATANPRTIVVLETGGPVLMPWLPQVAAVIEAWYPGIRGGEAIADVLFGDVNPSGRLPVTFPAQLQQLPRPVLDGFGSWGPDSGMPERSQPPFDVDYTIEGADVGYRWFARRGFEPLFAFGYGLSYTNFAYSDLKVTGGDTLTATFTVTNTGARAGKDTPQVYLMARPGLATRRLIGWSTVELPPGGSQRVTITADARVLADWDIKAGDWRIPAGKCSVMLGMSATDAGLTASTRLRARRLPP
jgi:beta-glucosidase